MSLIYLRFIDDIFFIWTGSKTDLEKNLNELNTKHPKKEFHFWIPKYILKTTICRQQYLARKQTGKPFFKINSEHPKSLKNSIPYSQTLRIKRICSTKKDFDHHSRELKKRFLKQGYDQKLIDEQSEKVDKLVQWSTKRKRSRTTRSKMH